MITGRIPKVGELWRHTGGREDIYKRITKKAATGKIAFFDDGYFYSVDIYGKVWATGSHIRDDIEIFENPFIPLTF